MTIEEFFAVADEVVQENGREGLSVREEVRRAIAIEADDRVLQILAGPGSGKTEVLIWRILYELLVLGTDAARILVTTFTRKAANELQVRVTDRSDAFIDLAQVLGVAVTDPRVHNLRVGTLHSLCDQMLTEFDPAYRAAGLTLIDEHEHRARLGFQGDFVRGTVRGYLSRLSAIPQLTGLFRPWWKPTNWPVNRFDRLSLLLDLYTHIVETYIPRCVEQQQPHGLVAFAPNIDSALIGLQQAWSEKLEEKHVVDFAGIQLKLLSSQAVLHGRLSHIFVDEFQDNNPIQFALHVGWLADPNTKLTVVGDDDQAIYRFRGSDAACFHQLKSECQTRGFRYRQERLTTNYRSSRNIVRFAQEFRSESAIAEVSMDKLVGAPENAENGAPVRILRGNIHNVCATVANEIIALGYGAVDPPQESVAILSFSTSEKKDRPAAILRSALEPVVPVYNPRAKTAAQKGSALADLLGILSYMVDPITVEPVGVGGRRVMVWSQQHSESAITRRPLKADGSPFMENDDHIDFQKWFRKTGTQINATAPEKQEILDYVDQIKAELVQAGCENTRLTLAGLLARILSFPFFADTGFTIQLLRQALFTQLFEAFVLPTRQTANPLDSPLEVSFENGKWHWHKKYWSFMAVFASVLKNISVDDTESEAFEENAVPILTFHQAKGLEFDHVYVIGGGRQLDVYPVLKNMLFSGLAVQVYVNDKGLTDTDDAEARTQAQADADREFYVAISRPRMSLTILSATNDDDEFRESAKEHPVVSTLVDALPRATEERDEVTFVEINYE